MKTEVGIAGDPQVGGSNIEALPEDDDAYGAMARETGIADRDTDAAGNSPLPSALFSASGSESTSGQAELAIAADIARNIELEDEQVDREVVHGDLEHAIFHADLESPFGFDDAEQAYGGSDRRPW